MATRQLFSLALLFSCTLLLQTSVAQQDYPPAISPLPSIDAGYGTSLGQAPYIQQQSTGAPPNTMLWQQYQALQIESPSQGCQTCSADGPGNYNRCGCDPALFPWHNGPGNCDRWCVGPKWGVDAGALIMFRDDADWGLITAGFGPTPELEDQFDHGPGARLFVTGYNDAGYGIQVGYEGINDWNANLAYAPGDLVANQTRTFTYESRLNSIEINFLPHVPYAWKWFSGFRYVELSEGFLDSDTTTKTVPAPATPAGSTNFVDQNLNNLVKNRLFGLQLGGHRDAWQWGNRLTLQTFANAGVYCNKFRRTDVNSTTTTTVTGDDTATTDVTELSNTSSTFTTATRRDLAEVAFLGEAGLSATLKLNHCTALRTGYQVLFVDGVGEALTASLSPDLNGSSLVYHGLQFGFEYRR